jgi:hypothetical protein
MKKVVNVVSFALTLALLSSLALLTGLAQEGNETKGVICESDVVVQTDDWLSKLAEKFYGTALAFPLIYNATNIKAAEDKSYATIKIPDLIEPGWKLCIPNPTYMQAVLNREIAPIPEEVSASPIAVPIPELAEYNGVFFIWKWEGTSSVSDNDWYFDIKIFPSANAEIPYDTIVANPQDTLYIDGKWLFEGKTNFRSCSHWAVQIAQHNPNGSYAGPLSLESDRLPVNCAGRKDKGKDNDEIFPPYP